MFNSSVARFILDAKIIHFERRSATMWKNPSFATRENQVRKLSERKNTALVVSLKFFIIEE